MNRPHSHRNLLWSGHWPVVFHKQTGTLLYSLFVSWSFYWQSNGRVDGFTMCTLSDAYIYTCMKISMVIFIIDILVFILIVFLSMSDSKSPEIASILLFLLQHILSLPLSLLNDNLPFYLEYREFPNSIFISLPANIILQSIFCFAIIKSVKWCITTIVGNRLLKK